MKRVYKYIKENEDVTLALLQGVLEGKGIMSGLSEVEETQLDDYFGTRTKDTVVETTVDSPEPKEPTKVDTTNTEDFDKSVRQDWVSPLQWAQFSTNCYKIDSILAQRG